jgi:hypothetical protein
LLKEADSSLQTKPLTKDLAAAQRLGGGSMPQADNPKIAERFDDCFVPLTPEALRGRWSAIQSALT